MDRFLPPSLSEYQPDEDDFAHCEDCGVRLKREEETICARCDEENNAAWAAEMQESQAEAFADAQNRRD